VRESFENGPSKSVDQVRVAALSLPTLPDVLVVHSTPFSYRNEEVIVHIKNLRSHIVTCLIICE
jgi:hypothetical protein